ncbi:hypothetical protein NDU88_002106 [Pleurodeles waltl]|uniref:Uncharacterized protein n=1 Tax=Pleurodeles waltl TaxID=8319 RepID=A0AAV7TJV9_PLEWA|nr:hypothetical protein NDU88_002106 [Pleurodeles waltl]
MPQLEDGAVVGRVLWSSKTVSDKQDPESSCCPSGTAHREGGRSSCPRSPSDPARLAEKLKYVPRSGQGKRQDGPVRGKSTERGEGRAGDHERGPRKCRPVPEAPGPGLPIGRGLDWGSAAPERHAMATEVRGRNYVPGAARIPPPAVLQGQEARPALGPRSCGGPRDRGV